MQCYWKITVLGVDVDDHDLDTQPGIFVTLFDERNKTIYKTLPYFESRWNVAFYLPKISSIRIGVQQVAPTPPPPHHRILLAEQDIELEPGIFVIHGIGIRIQVEDIRETIGRDYSRSIDRMNETQRVYKTKFRELLKQLCEKVTFHGEDVLDIVSTLKQI